MKSHVLALGLKMEITPLFQPQHRYSISSIFRCLAQVKTVPSCWMYSVSQAITQGQTLQGVFNSLAQRADLSFGLQA